MCNVYLLASQIRNALLLLIVLLVTGCFALWTGLRTPDLDFLQMKLNWNIKTKETPNTVQLGLALQSRRPD